MPPPHPLGCHQCLGAAQPRGGIFPHPRGGISLTLLHCSCCRVWDRCGTEGCCTGGQRRLRGFLLSIDQPQRGPEHGRSACSKSLLLPHCPAETLKGQHSAVQPSARIRPQRRGSPDFPRLRKIPVLFSAEGPWTPRGHQGCDVTDTSWEERVSPAGRYHRDGAEHLLGMGEVLGSLPGISKGASALTAQPQAGVGCSSGTGPLQALRACLAPPGLICVGMRAVGGLCALPLLSPSCRRRGRLCWT